MSAQIDFEGEGLLAGLRGNARKARLELLEQLAADGVSLEDLRQAVAANRLALLPVERVLEGGGERYTIEQVAERSGVSVKMLRRYRQAYGLPQPPPEEAAFDEQDVEAAKRLKTFMDAGLPEEGLLQTSRIVGMSMAQIAAANRELVGSALMREGDTERDLGLRYAQAARELGPMVGPMLEYVLNMHQREQVRRDVIGRANLSSGEFEGTSEIDVCFADLVGFTKLGERLSPNDLGGVASRLGDLAAEVASPPVHLIKLIGDAAMLVSREPVPLVDSALRLVEAAEEEGEGFPQVRAGAAHGMALGHSGDWYGRPVNMASRITAVARPGSLLASEELVRAAGERFHYSFARERRLRGIEGSVRLYRVRREEDAAAAADRGRSRRRSRR